ncbi:hypothetical protein WB401_21065 [Streptomyces brasiliscabiei]|uniref:acetyl-CoA C-acetyltransferase n=1 Tax=Streptomyces brasiliscabiei TaxID=2736302 RepID=A0ABU8G7U0_9ACTN
MSESVILAGACTPSGDLFAGLGALNAVTLGALIIEGALDRAGVSAGEVDYVITGQEQARRTARGARIPDRVPAVSVSGARLCGLNAIALADRLIRSGEGDVVVVGGVDPGGVRSMRCSGTPDPCLAGGPPRRADCAVAVVLMRRTRADRLGLPWLARVGAHSAVTGSAGSSCAGAVRAIRQALLAVPATPRDLRFVDVRQTSLMTGADPAPAPPSAVASAFDTTGVRTVLRLAQTLARKGGGMGAAGIWGDHRAEAVIVCARTR